MNTRNPIYEKFVLRQSEARPVASVPSETLRMMSETVSVEARSVSELRQSEARPAASVPSETLRMMSETVSVEARQISSPESGFLDSIGWPKCDRASFFFPHGAPFQNIVQNRHKWHHLDSHKMVQSLQKRYK